MEEEKSESIAGRFPLSNEEKAQLLAKLGTEAGSRMKVQKDMTPEELREVYKRTSEMWDMLVKGFMIVVEENSPVEVLRPLIVGLDKVFKESRDKNLNNLMMICIETYYLFLTRDPKTHARIAHELETALPEESGMKSLLRTFALETVLQELWKGVEK